MSWPLFLRDAIRPPNSYSMTGSNPAYAEKMRAREGVWQAFTRQPQPRDEWAGNNPRSGFIGTEKQIQLNRDQRVMYPHRTGWHSNPIISGPVYLNHMPQPTSPEITDRLDARNNRSWYPVGYDPYAGWLGQRGSLSVGIYV